MRLSVNHERKPPLLLGLNLQLSFGSLPAFGTWSADRPFALF